MKKFFLLAVLGLLIALPSNAQEWNKWDTRSTIDGVLNLGKAVIESAERKKEMEILARQKVEFEQSFQDAMTEAKAFEEKQNWEEALEIRRGRQAELQIQLFRPAQHFEQNNQPVCQGWA